MARFDLGNPYTTARDFVSESASSASRATGVPKGLILSLGATAIVVTAVAIGERKRKK